MATNIIGYGPKTLANASVPVPLTSGGTYTLPSGQYQLALGQYTMLQWFDPVTTLWRPFQTVAQSDSFIISSDGSNYRLANLTGTAVGAIVTNGGTGYTNGIYPAGTGLGTAASPTCTFAAGGGTVLATGNVIVGGVINTSVTITTAGSNYTKAPILTITPPPAGGVPATATCTISAGAINAVTVTNAGAGYTSAPTITVTNANGDTTGSGGVLTVNATLAQSGAISAITVANNGAGMTSVPAITFSPASTSAATAIMCFTGLTVTATGTSNAGNGNMAWIVSTVVTGASTTTNPAITTGLFTPRPGFTAYNTSATGATQVLVDGGLHQIVPNVIVMQNSNGTISAAATPAVTQGGTSDLSFLVPI